MNSFLLYKEGTLDAILFDITAGEVTDLGRLEYSELPLPQSTDDGWRQAARFRAEEPSRIHVPIQ